MVESYVLHPIHLYTFSISDKIEGRKDNYVALVEIRSLM